jgi:carboxyl-terminal processing protease
MYRKSLISLMTLLLVFSCQRKSEGLRQSDIPMLVDQFLAMHVEYNSLDDNLSERILDNYINALDYGKYYFYKEDIESFQKNRKLFDDFIAEGNLEAVYEMHEKYKLRFEETMKLFDELIRQPHDFTRDEQIIVDRDRVDYALDRKDMKERWRKSIKLQLLNYMSTGKTVEESKEKLKNKYRVMKKRIDAFDEKEILSRFINAVSTALDPHSNYLTQDEHEDFKISMELKLEGIGVRLSSEDGLVTVESIILGGAADKLPEELKLKTRDRIVAVAQGAGEPVDVIDMELRDVVKLIRGKKGTEVRLTLLREAANGDKPARMIVPIIREEIRLQDSDADYELIEGSNTGGKKIGYIKLPSFYQDSARGKSSAGDMKAILKGLNEKKADLVVLDLRGNPGGLLNEAIEIAGLFIDYGPIVQIKEKQRQAHVIFDQKGSLYDGPMIVLINKFSASAAEILAGAMKDYRRALVIGPENSFGKGTVQSYNELPFNKGAIKITTHIFYQPGGSSNQLNGIMPDITVPDLSAIWDIGESKARYALQWKKIQSASFKPSGKINREMTETLARKSKGRIASSSKFTELTLKIKTYRDQLDKKSISLKEESEIEGKKKKELEKTLNRESSEQGVDLEKDLFLGESMNIARDYLQLLGSCPPLSKTARGRAPRRATL